jgi:hypothetical protein
MRNLIVRNPWSAISGAAIFCLFLVGTSLGQQSPEPAQDKKPAGATEVKSPKNATGVVPGNMAQMMMQMQQKVGGGRQQPAGKPSEPTLEEMLQKALKDNPDIRVAEAKVREADAELNRTRLQVTQKVLAFHHSRESQKAIIKVAEEDLQRIQKLEASKAVSQEDVKQAQQRLSSSKAKLAEIEAEMPYLLGQQNRLNVASVAFSPIGKTLYTGELDGTVRLWDATTGQQIPGVNFNNSRLPFNPPVWDLNKDPIPNFNVELSNLYQFSRVKDASASQNTGSIKDKVRKALDAMVTVDYKQKKLCEIFDDLKKKAPGLSIHDLSTLSLRQISLQIEGQVPLRTVLELIEDTCSVLSGEGGGSVGRMSFVLRDYGLLFAPNDNLPPGAVHINNLNVPVHLITPDQEKTPAKEEKKPPAAEKKN